MAIDGTVRGGLTYSCDECGFSTKDFHLAQNHSCEVQAQGGTCEDYPACGHEWGDCNGLKYGSDEAIKEQASHHFLCAHEQGYCVLDEYDEEEPDDEPDVMACPDHGDQFVTSEGSTGGPDPYATYTLACGHRVSCFGPGEENVII